jgi:hypothetical protein
MLAYNCFGTCRALTWPATTHTKGKTHVRPLQLISLSLILTLIAPMLPAAATYPMKYEGGSLDLNQHDKLKTTILADGLEPHPGKEEIHDPRKGHD